MARIRTIKPDFCTSEQVVECSRDARLLFILMWCFCDDAGRHKASVKKLRMECFPGDALGDAEVTQLVDELIREELIEEYEVDGKRYWQVLGWDHQKIDNPTVKHPNTDGCVEKFSRRLGGKQRQIIKQKLIDRDGEKCCHCDSKKNLAIDHIIPRSKGGSNELDNLQLLCKPCNNEKFTSVTHKVRGGDSPPEGKGREGSGKDEDAIGDKSPPASPPKKQSSVQSNPPSVEEVRTYMFYVNKDPKEAEAFIDFYTANGWVQGRGKPIKDWQAAVRNWFRNDQFRTATAGSKVAGGDDLRDWSST